MANENLTIYQKLTRMFGYAGEVKPDEPKMKNSPKFNFSKDELLN
jgi:hypothetical protein